MKKFWAEELKTKCIEIAFENENPEMVSSVIEAYDRILHFDGIAKKEGLLALEEAGAELDREDSSQELFYKMIRLVVDGLNMEYVSSIGANYYITLNLPSYAGLMNMMYIQGILLIQGGVPSWIIKETLKSMMPKVILEKVNRRECEEEHSDTLGKTEKEENILKKVCEDHQEIDERDHSIFGETARTLLMLSDTDMQRLLRDTDNGLLAVAMKGLPGSARAKILNNLSTRLAEMVAEDLFSMGPVRRKDVEEFCVEIMRTLLELENKGEIQGYDFSVLKILLDIFDSAEKENRDLREKYNGIRAVLNQIYNN
ncbi:MAG: FliG C-terminal domain-containing protein [Lachnospiraceae bacterium]